MLFFSVKLNSDLPLQSNFQITMYIVQTSPNLVIQPVEVHLIHRRIVHRHITLNTSLSSTSVEISLGYDKFILSVVYKRPSDQLLQNDLNTITQSSKWFVAVGDLNAKHFLWNSRCVNAAGLVLYRHASQSDYSIKATGTPTHFPGTWHHRPDVLDIALVKLPLQTTQITNLSELSSDHNPILLQISDSAITSTLPANNFKINWNKFETTIDHLFPTANPQKMATASKFLQNNCNYIRQTQDIKYSQNYVRRTAGRLAHSGQIPRCCLRSKPKFCQTYPRHRKESYHHQSQALPSPKPKKPDPCLNKNPHLYNVHQTDSLLRQTILGPLYLKI